MSIREIVLDTETTGLDPFMGDRIVEIGCVELVNHLPTGRTYHQYINPERTMPTEAFQVHGLGDDFLAKQPVFAKIVDAFLEFIDEAVLVIHNAPFDMKFLNAELEWLQKPRLPFRRVIDTLEMARSKFPGSQVSLDALCKRFGIDNTTRTLHGALLDSELLAEVYLELIGGRQQSLTGLQTAEEKLMAAEAYRPPPRPTPLPARITDAEQTAHAAFIHTLGDEALWRDLDSV